MDFQQRLYMYLRAKGVPFVMQHLVSTNQSSGCRLAVEAGGHALVRTGMAFVGRQLTMVVTLADQLIDPLLLNSSMLHANASLADPATLAPAFPDVQLAAIPPLGELWQIPVIADEAVAKADAIQFFAGSRDHVVTLCRADFEHLTAPSYFKLAVAQGRYVPVLA